MPALASGVVVALGCWTPTNMVRGSQVMTTPVISCQVPPDLAGSRVGPNFDPAGDQAELVSCIERLEWVGDSGVKKRVLGGHGQAKLAMTYST